MVKGLGRVLELRLASFNVGAYSIRCGYIGIIWGLYRDDGQENTNYRDYTAYIGVI